jgi:hypothetical protein
MIKIMSKISMLILMVIPLVVFASNPSFYIKKDMLHLKSEAQLPEKAMKFLIKISSFYFLFKCHCKIRKKIQTTKKTTFRHYTFLP